MPEEAPIPTEPGAADPDQTPRRSSLLARFKVLGFVTAVIVVECLVAVLYLPSAAETAEMAEAMLAARSDPNSPLDLDEQFQEELPDQEEVDLGDFSVTAFQPLTNTALRIDFHLWGTVDQESYDDFMDRMEVSRHRFREKVIFTVRSADLSDLTDPQLGLIKRKLLEKTNKILGKPFLRVIIVDDFSFIEQ